MPIIVPLSAFALGDSGASGGVEGGGGGVDGVNPRTVALSAAGPDKRGVAGAPAAGGETGAGT
jgi:hypothetical protein